MSAEDPRKTELNEINSRLKTVVAYLKAKHTPHSVETSIEDAETYINDHTPAFITLDSSTFEGTRHVSSLFRLCDALEVKASMGGSVAMDECAALLARKVSLLKEVYLL